MKKNKLKRLIKAAKIIKTFIKQTLKNYNSMKKKLNALFLLTILLALSSCGSTKVLVDKPASGTQTTITVTTNNPITTDVSPKTNLNK